MKASVMFARFPYGNAEAPAVGSWLVRTIVKAKMDPRISDIFHVTVDDTPVTMSRNKAIVDALKVKADLLVMIDSDMRPDLHSEEPGYFLEDQRPFWDTALDFVINHAGPCVVAAPYCGPPPQELPYIFRVANNRNDNPNIDWRLEMYTREEAAQRSGVEQVAALPTGLMMIDMRAISKLRYPFFDYEWIGDGDKCLTCGLTTPGPRAAKASTEDVYFSRNLMLAGVPQYALWQCWAGHYKRLCVSKPNLLTVDKVIDSYREAISKGVDSREKLIHVGEGKPGSLGLFSRPPELSHVEPAEQADPVVGGAAGLTIVGGASCDLVGPGCYDG